MRQLKEPTGLLIREVLPALVEVTPVLPPQLAFAFKGQHFAALACKGLLRSDNEFPVDSKLM